MRYRTFHAPVDGVDRPIAQFPRPGAEAFFVLSETADESTWVEFLSQPVDSLWLFALPSPDISTSAANPWKIALELQGGKMVTMELYDTQSETGAVFLVRTYTDKKNAQLLDDWRELTTNSNSHVGRRMNTDVRFKQIVLEIEAAGLMNYQLKDGRGRRYWIKAVLSTIRRFIHDPLRHITLEMEVDELMRHCWINPRQYAAGYGFRGEPNNHLNIAKGIWDRPQPNQGEALS
ncbi:hypothetical protein F4805DRAFT_455991 [Annulohypoxylon moriforme]|nr:hypothetical protein F4805DRAFT_455991 [Annulohypoxylon moriforme]